MADKGSKSTMAITLNGQPHHAEAEDVATLLAALGVEGRRVAVMVNGAIVKRERWEATPIREGDVVEVLQMVGGG
jgi:sulfur carrier protein